jgi:hypothetical protein
MLMWVSAHDPLLGDAPRQARFQQKVIMKNLSTERSADSKGRDMARAVASGQRGVDGAANEEGRKLAQAVPGHTNSTNSTNSADGADGDGQERRRERISHLAYLRAEQRGFEPGNEVEDWLEAERQLNEEEGRGVLG